MPMDKKLHSLINAEIEKFPVAGFDVTGVLISDPNGLLIANKEITVAPGPVARLAELANALLGPRATVCLENEENQLLVQQHDQAVLGLYMKSTR